MRSQSSHDGFPSLNDWAGSIASGAVLGQLVVIWTSLCGTSIESLIALVAGITAGLVLARELTPFVDRRASFVIVTAALIVLSWAAPIMLDRLYSSSCQLMPMNWPAAETLTLLIPAAAVAIIVAVASGFRSCMLRDESSAWAKALFAGSIGPGFLLLHGISSWLPWPMALTVSLVIGMACAIRMRARSQVIQPNSTRAATTHITNPRDIVASHGTTATVIVLAIAGLFYVNRMIPLSLPVLFLAAAMTGAALLLLRAFVTRWIGDRVLGIACLFSILACSLLTTALVSWQLALRASGFSEWMTIALQSLQVAVILTVCSLPLISKFTDLHRPSLSRGTMLVMLLTATLSLVLIARGVSPTLLMAIGMFGLAGFTVAKTRTDDEATIDHRSRFWKRAAFCGLLILPAMLVATGPTITPEAARLLFSDRTDAALARGMDPAWILQSDARRLIEVQALDGDDIAVWSRSSSAFEFLRGGRSDGQVSTDTNLTPQSPANILAAVLPLVCHPQPQQVLVLGDDSGIILQTCTHFPIQQIVAVRRDASLTEMARRFTWRDQAIKPDDDDRVIIRHVALAPALRSAIGGRFDVVLTETSSVDCNVLPSNAEFYRAMTLQLRRDGVLGQRVRLPNASPEMLQQLLATAEFEFDHVGLVQVVPGEFLLLATNAEQGLIDDQLLTRLQREHVRQEIATTGWDWAQVAVLPLVSSETAQNLIHPARPSVYSISNGRWAMSAPVDAAVRRDRSAELQHAFGPWQMQLNAAVEVGEDHKEANRRLSSLNQELEILGGIPDQPWTYRKSLRMEMQRDPRPPKEIVESGKIVRVAHPLDQLRKDYFSALGAVARSQTAETIAIEAIRRLAEFTNVAEPLLSHFAHYELIRIHELAGHPDADSELQHRLHVVFYSTPADASVRPVIGAIRQIVEHPELIADDAQRYDELNALMQKLIERWEVRTAWEPRSVSRVQNDVDQSVHVAMLAMEMLEANRAAAGVSEEQLRLRRRFVTAALLSPLREYRDQVLAYRLKSETYAETETLGTEDPDDLPLMVSDEAVNTN